MLDRPSDNPSPEPKGEVVYSFPTRSRCPNALCCQSLDTEAVSTHGGVQYRRCRQCGCRYKVIGVRV